MKFSGDYYEESLLTTRRRFFIICNRLDVSRQDACVAAHLPFTGTDLEYCYDSIVTVPKQSGKIIYVRRENLRLLLVFCTGPFWYTQQLSFQHTLRLYISHGTDTIMTQYDAGRTEIPLGPLDVCIWVSPFLAQDSPIEGTPRQCPSCGIFAAPLN
jgi:hypothetical protein